MESRRIITAGGTLLCALGVGYLMQQDKAPARQAPVPAEVSAPADPVPAPTQEANVDLEVTGVQMTSALPIPPMEAAAPAPLNEPKPIPVAVTNDPIAEMPREEAAPAFSCDISLKARSVAAAMVSLELSAPCLGNERYTLHHNGMMFTEATNDAGVSAISVPALSENAVFIVAFANGEGAVANAKVTSLEYYDRAVVQWKGDAGLQLHAMEYGADYGDAGHVWSQTMGDMTETIKGESGFLTQLGDPAIDEALLAEVYTFPSGTAARDGNVALSVEAEVTQANCAKDVEAQSMQITPQGAIKVQDVVLAMPECNAVGDFLVLTNLLSDLQIAAR